MPLGRRKRSLVQCWDGEHRLTGWSLTSVQIMENSVQERRGTLLVRLVSNFSSKGWKILYKFVTGLPRWSYVGQSLSLGERSEEARLPFRKSILFKSWPICIKKYAQSCVMLLNSGLKSRLISDVWKNTESMFRESATSLTLLRGRRKLDLVSGYHNLRYRHWSPKTGIEEY